MPKISIGSWAFTFGPFEKEPWSFDKVLDYAADAGYDGVEINGFHPHPHPDVYNTPEKCKELMRQVQDKGLGISGYAPSFVEVPPAEVEQEAYLKEFRKALAFCEWSDIKTLRIDTVSPPDELSPEVYQERYARLVSTWRAAAEESAKVGVTTVWEFEPGFWLNKPSEIKKLVEDVGHDHFRLLFDTSHAYMSGVVAARHVGEKEVLPGGVEEFARLVSDYIGHFHLIDSDGTLHDDETSTHARFGHGKIDFKSVLNVLKPVVGDYEWWCLDFCFNADVEEGGREGVQFVRRLIDEM